MHKWNVGYGLLTQLGLILMAGALYGQGNHLTIAVEHIQNGEGKIRIALFNSKDSFLKKEYTTKSTQAVKGNVSVDFDNLPPGEYAVSVFHDSNENNELDTNFFGIPKEGYGFTNGVQGSFGPPSFEKAKFVWKGFPETILVPLRYL